MLRYCPTTDTWSVLHTCPVHVRKQQMLALEDTIYLVGGYTRELMGADHGEDKLTVQSYNVHTHLWLQLQSNPSKSGLNLTCALHNDGIFIMSRDVGPHTGLERRVFIKYNLFTDAWEAFSRFSILGHNALLCSLYLPSVL